MKKISIIFAMLLSVIIGISVFSSCSSDDDPLVEEKSLANTIWYVYNDENYLNGEKVDGYKFTSRNWNLYADGTCTGFNKGKWHMGGNSIYVTTNYSGFEEVSEYKIIESKTDAEKGTWEMVLRMEYEDDEFDYQLYYMRLNGVINEK